MDSLNNLEAGRWAVNLSLIGARAFGWLVLIELAKAPREPLACEGWSRRGLRSERSAGAGVGTDLPPIRTLYP